VPPVIGLDIGLSISKNMRAPCATWNRLARFSTLAAALHILAAGHAAPICSTCHPKETARYLQTGMGKSLLPAAPVEGGQILHNRSGSRIDVIVQGGRMFHRLTEAGLTAEYPIAYQIGSGKAGRGYIARVGDYLIQSPAAWYNPQGWDVAPGFVAARLLDFDRIITETCLFCHADTARFAEDGRRFVGPAPAVANWIFRPTTASNLAASSLSARPRRNRLVAMI